MARRCAPMQLTTIMQHANIVRDLLGASASLPNVASRPPLHFIARRGCANICQHSLDSHLSIGVVARDIVSYTPLHSAALSTSVEVADSLKCAGAEVNARSCYGGTLPWSVAILR
jgi:ankyrin repeat protein